MHDNTSSALAVAIAMTVALALPGTTHAEDADAENPAKQLEPLVVTATRMPDDALVVPAAIDVITAKEIARAQPRIDLAESLDRIPGVVARDRQNRAQDLQVSIRGHGARATFGVRGVRLYTDGIPATMPDGQGQVSHFSLESAARIEVLRGPFSALYGNASGGVIELFTADAPADPLLRGRYVAGEDGLRRTSLSFHSRWGNDGDVLIDVSDLDDDGFREHSEARLRNGQLVLKGALGANARFTVLGNWLDLEALDPQGLTAEQLAGNRRASSANALLFDTRKTVHQDQAGVRIEQAFSADHAFMLMAYSGNRETAQMLSIPVFVQEDPLQGGGAIDLDRGYHGADLRWQWKRQAFSFTAGVAREVSDERRRGYENFINDRIGVFGALRRDEDNRVTGDALYVQAGIEPAKRWRINIGARRSEIRFTSDDRYITGQNPDDSGALEYAHTSPVAGVLFRVTPGLSVYANAGTGFETPTFSELAYRRDGRSGLNDALSPATSRNYEAGVRARHASVEYAAAIFDTRTEDELVVIANEGGRSVYGNAGISRRRGIELAFAADIASRWRLASAWTLLDAKYRRGFSADLDGHDIPGLSRHFAWSELAWSPRTGTTFLIEGRYVSAVYVNDENSEAAAPYASFDLGAEQRIDAAGIEWTAFARISNVLDREYVGSVIVNEGNGRYYEPAPGRRWMLGITAAKSFH